MSTVAAARSSFRSAASRLSSAAKPKASPSQFRIPTQKPTIATRILRSPVEMSSFCVESMLPYHTATASALLTSMLSVAPRHYVWTLEASGLMCIAALSRSCKFLKFSEVGQDGVLELIKAMESVRFDLRVSALVHDLIGTIVGGRDMITKSYCCFYIWYWKKCCLKNEQYQFLAATSTTCYKEIILGVGV